MDFPVDILGLDFENFSRQAADRIPGGRGVAGRIYSRAFSAGRVEVGDLGLAERNRRAWEEAFTVGLLSPRRRVSEEGEFGATEKVVLGLADGQEVECVLIPMPARPRAEPDGTTHKRSTLCVSSQVGCRQGCAFCETGRVGLARNLSAAEIVSQLVTTRLLFGWEPNNVVFMGMGEPLDNLEGLRGALAVLTERRGLAFAWERLTVCTSGDAVGLAELRGFVNPRLNLSLSLNAADDVTRNRIMPSNRRSDLAALADALRDWPRRRNFVLALNWCLLPGINDRREDARAAARYARELGRAIVNLIPYNPGSRPIAPAPSEDELERFEAWLEEEGCLVKRRARKGSGIMAACGQLGGPAARESAEAAIGEDGPTRGNCSQV